MSALLLQLIEQLASGAVQVVDLTQPLGPATPVIGLPPPFASSPGLRIDTISRYDQRGPACVIDISWDAATNPDVLVTPANIAEWERAHGRIPVGAWVLVRTDWSRRSDPAQFLNVAGDGPHSPGFDAAASRLLAEERDVLGVGVETVGTDAGQAGRFDPPFPNHHIMHGAGKFGLASLCNLHQLPPVGAVVIAAPLKIVGGSGSPVRVIALVPQAT